MNADFTRGFPRQLRFWALHVTLNALPSFIISISVFRFDRQPVALIAILTALMLFIVALAAIAAMIPDLNRDAHPLSRGLRAAMKIRAWVSGLSAAMLVIAPPSVLLIPDFWCGYFAASVVEGIARWWNIDAWSVDSGALIPVLLTTTLEGLLIAIGIAMMAFFLCLYNQDCDRRKAFTSAGSPAPLR